MAPQIQANPQQPDSQVIQVKPINQVEHDTVIDQGLIKSMYGQAQVINGNVVYIDPVTKKPRKQEDIV